MGEIRKIGVLGSGVMGSGIAAHIANAGIPVVLLDIAAEGSSERSSLASGAIARMLTSKPAPLMVEKNAKLIFKTSLYYFVLLFDCLSCIL